MANWFSPLINSDFVMDCFENAARARQIDMRASPYDVSEFGLEAIRVESPEGRREYADAQKDLMQASIPLRSNLLDFLITLQYESQELGTPKHDPSTSGSNKVRATQSS